MTLFKNFFWNWFSSETNFSKTTAFSNVISKFESKNSLFFLANQIWKKFFNYFFGYVTCGLISVHSSLSYAVWLFLNNCSSSIKKFFESNYWAWVSHSYHKTKKVFVSLTCGCFVEWITFYNANTSFSIKESSKIFDSNDTVIHTQQNTLEHLEKQANSVKIQNGQRRAKRSKFAMSVCNEHILAPKGMTCSDLYRNIESMTEMFMPAFI